MSTINTGRVVAGGLVAGVVMNVIDAGSGMLFLDDQKEMVQRLSLDPALKDPSFGNMAPWLVVDFMIGILIVLNYAAMRPRFGPGPKTALMAGLILYAAVTIVLYGFESMGIFSQAMFLHSSLAALVSVSLGSLAGGAVYKE